MSRPLGTDLRRTAWRIGLQTGLLLIVCLLFVGALVYVTVVRDQDQQLNQSLTDAIAQTRSGADDDRDGDHGATQLSGGLYTSVLHHGELTSSRLVPAGLPDLAVMEQVARDGQEDRRTITVASGRYRVLTVKRGDEVVQAMASLFQQHQERERILGALGLAGGVGLVLATLLAALLARRAVRPMAQALELQRRFVADAGHELRTPLTLLNTRAQLLSERVHASGSPNSQDELVIRDADGIVADTRALTEVLEELLLAADTRTPLPRRAGRPRGHRQRRRLIGSGDRSCGSDLAIGTGPRARRATSWCSHGPQPLRHRSRRQRSRPRTRPGQGRGSPSRSQPRRRGVRRRPGHSGRRTPEDVRPLLLRPPRRPRRQPATPLRTRFSPGQ